MAILNGVLINGINYSWANIIAVVMGTPIIGITKLDYSRKQTFPNNYGFGSEPISRGQSRIEYAGSMEIYYDELRAIALASPNSDILSIPPFQIQVTMASLPGSPFTVVPSQNTLYNVQFESFDFKSAEGEGKIMVTVPFVYAGLTVDF